MSPVTTASRFAATEHAVRGKVASFDDTAGLGTVSVGGSEIGFHCTAIADGSRQIAVGTPVVLRVAPGHGGVFEGRDLVDERH